VTSPALAAYATQRVPRAPSASLAFLRHPTNFSSFPRKIVAHCQAALKPVVIDAAFNRGSLSAIGRLPCRESAVRTFGSSGIRPQPSMTPAAGAHVPCIVDNFSNGGAKISSVRPETVPDEFMLRITPHSPPRKCHVIWRSADALGVEFTERRAEEPVRGASQKHLRCEPA
jgi:hypothetical protein